VTTVLLVFAVLAAACSGGEVSPTASPTGSEPPAGGRIVVGATLEPTTLDITAAAAAAIGEVFLYNVQEGLVKLDDNGHVQPLLAERWDRSADGRAYTFHLREATFHDGSDFTADDVVYSFERVLDEDSTHPFKAQLAKVESVTAVDDRTVEIRLTEFSNDFLFSIAQAVGVILSEESIGQRETSPVGTGPFQFDSRIPGDSITLARYDDHWGRGALLDEVVFKYIDDPNALSNALLDGQVDVISRITAPEGLGQFTQEAGFTVIDGLTNGEIILAMNNARPPLDDVRVRQAITHAIDRQGIVDAAYAGYGELIGSHVPPQDPWYVDLTDAVPYDPARARELLAEAGHADDITLALRLPPPSYARRSGELIASQLGEVGITVTIEPVEFPVWLEEVFNADQYDLTVISHVEPHDFVQYGNAEYYWNYDSPEVREWLANADRELDIGRRNELYAQVQQRITEDAVNVWLFLLPNLAVLREGIDGYQHNRISTSLDMTAVSITPRS